MIKDDSRSPAGHYLFSVGRVNRVPKDCVAVFMRPACEESIFFLFLYLLKGARRIFPMDEKWECVVLKCVLQGTESFPLGEHESQCVPLLFTALQNKVISSRLIWTSFCNLSFCQRQLCSTPARPWDSLYSLHLPRLSEFRRRRPKQSNSALKENTTRY